MYTALDQKYHEGQDSVCCQPLQVQRPRWVFPAVAVLFISITLNMLLVIVLVRTYNHSWDLLDDTPSKYAGLRRKTSIVMNTPSDYRGSNQTIADAAWHHKNLDIGNFVVALDDTFIASHALWETQRWPWDETKGIYFIAAGHEFHCVDAMRTFVAENTNAVPARAQTYSAAHLDHCLDMLRESIMCNADDTPLYHGILHGNINATHPRVGTGQKKLCRDWTALLDWTQAHSACYRDIHGPGVTELDHYMFCPDGSQPWLR